MFIWRWCSKTIKNIKKKIIKIKCLSYKNVITWDFQLMPETRDSRDAKQKSWAHRTIKNKFNQRPIYNLLHYFIFHFVWFLCLWVLSLVFFNKQFSFKKILCLGHVHVYKEMYKNTNSIYMVIRMSQQSALVIYISLLLVDCLNIIQTMNVMLNKCMSGWVGLVLCGVVNCFFLLDCRCSTYPYVHIFWSQHNKNLVKLIWAIC